MIAVVGAGAMGAALALAGNRTPRSLANAGLIEVRDEKGPQVADRLFAARYAPWCPDNF